MALKGLEGEGAKHNKEKAGVEMTFLDTELLGSCLFIILIPCFVICKAAIIIIFFSFSALFSGFNKAVHISQVFGTAAGD